MAKGKGSIQGWITKNGVHIPIYGNYTVREGHEPTAKGSRFRKKLDLTDKGTRDLKGRQAPNDLPRVSGESNKTVEYNGQKYNTVPTVDYDNNKNEQYVAGHTYVPIIENKNQKDSSSFFVAEDGTMWRSGSEYMEDKRNHSDTGNSNVSEGHIEEGKDVQGKKPDRDEVAKSNHENMLAVKERIREKEAMEERKEKYANRDWNKDVEDSKRYGYSAQTEEGKKPVTKAEEEKQARQSFRDKKAQEQGFASAKDMESYNAETGVNKETWKEQESSRYHDKMTTPYKDLNDKQKAFVKELAEDRAGHKLSNEGVQFYQNLENDERSIRQAEIKERESKQLREIPKQASSTPDFSKMSYSEAGKYVAEHKKDFGLKDSDDAYLAAYDMKNGEWKGDSTLQENRKWANDMNKKTMVDGPSSTPRISAKAQKVADNARKSLMFDKGYAEISPNHWGWAGMSNDKVVAALNASDPKYSYEMRTESEKGGAMLNNGTINHTRLYRTEKSHGSLTAKKDTTNMMTKAKAAAGGNKPMKNPKTTSLMTKKKAEARAASFSSMSVSGLKQAFANASADEKAKIRAALQAKGYIYRGGKWTKKK